MDDNTLGTLAIVGTLIVCMGYVIFMMWGMRGINKSIELARKKQWQREKEIHDFLKEKENRYMKKTREKWEKEDQKKS